MLINNGGILMDQELMDYFEKGDFTDLKITPVYLPYSYWRCKKLLYECYGIDMITRTGYKLDRYRGHHTYRLVFIDSQEVINECIDLKQIRYFLASHRHPLHEPKNLRNQNAEHFLEIVEQIGKE